MEEILHQLIGSLSHDFQGFVHPRWCRISSINGMFGKLVETTMLQPLKISQPLRLAAPYFLQKGVLFLLAGPGTTPQVFQFFGVGWCGEGDDNVSNGRPFLAKLTEHRTEHRNCGLGMLGLSHSKKKTFTNMAFFQQHL